MGGRRNTAQRKLSAGTVFMLALLIVVLCGSALVLGRLSSGASVDLSRLSMNVLDIREDPARDAALQDDEPEPTPKKKKQSQKAALPEATPVPQGGADSFTLTVGGSISLSGEVRKNSRSTDSKVADYADVMMLLKHRIRSDVNGVFLENVLSDRYKASDVTAPTSASVLLTEAGFDMAACGFARAFANGQDGVVSTLKTLESKEIRVTGIRGEDYDASQEVRSIKGIQAAFLQYTSTVAQKTRKDMEKAGTSGMVPDADLNLITKEIASARKKGAEAVIVMLNWGKTAKDPDRTQRTLAEGIAKAGADLIIGNGSHVPQGAEYFSGKDGKKVLCVWSLGTMLTGDRANIKRMSGYLLHVTVRRDGQGGVSIADPEYTPLYTWRYKQDGRFYYRCVAADGKAPDGMDSEQRKLMEKAAETVANALKGSPVSARDDTDAD